MKQRTGYEYSRAWFNFCFENPQKINPNHSALYFFCIEHCNRLGWKDIFGLPTTMAKEAIGIRSYNTYINTLNDLIEFGFIELIEKSRNQYSSNIIALSINDKALNKALDKATIKHVIKQTTKQRESTGESISSIDKQYNQELLTNNYEEYATQLFSESETLFNVEKASGKKPKYETAEEFNANLILSKKIHENFSEWVSHFSNWLRTSKTQIQSKSQTKFDQHIESHESALKLIEQQNQGL